MFTQRRKLVRRISQPLTIYLFIVLTDVRRWLVKARCGRRKLDRDAGAIDGFDCAVLRMLQPHGFTARDHTRITDRSLRIAHFGGGYAKRLKLCQ